MRTSQTGVVCCCLLRLDSMGCLSLSRHNRQYPIGSIPHCTWLRDLVCSCLGLTLPRGLVTHTNLILPCGLVPHTQTDLTVRHNLVSSHRDLTPGHCAVPPTTSYTQSRVLAVHDKALVSWTPVHAPRHACLCTLPAPQSQPPWCKATCNSASTLPISCFSAAALHRSLRTPGSGGSPPLLHVFPTRDPLTCCLLSAPTPTRPEVPGQERGPCKAN